MVKDENDPAESIIVTKSDVATRQLKTAITLFFEGHDPVVVHTIVAAAHQILFDLGSKKEVGSALKNTSRLNEAELREHINAVNYAFNFFKHADKDSDRNINIAPLSRFTQDFIMDSILMLQKLNGDIPYEAQIFWHWFVSKYPEEFDNLPEDGEIAKMQELKMSEMSFKKISLFIKYCERKSKENVTGRHSRFWEKCKRYFGKRIL